jgi:hypothetical protein
LPLALPSSLQSLRYRTEPASKSRFRRCAFQEPYGAMTCPARLSF